MSEAGLDKSVFRGELETLERMQAKIKDYKIIGKIGWSTDHHLMIEGEWGFACYDKGCIWIPSIFAVDTAKTIINALVDIFGTNRIIFSAVLFPEKIKAHFHSVVREWDVYFPEINSDSHCIEIIWDVGG